MPVKYRLPSLFGLTFLTTAVLAFGLSLSNLRSANAEAVIVVEADTGKVLHAENATYPWYPASITKLMTAYVTLRAIKDGRITLDSLYTVSPIAASQSPSKMGFKPGTQLTVDNALKMMLVKSANDMAVVLAEGLDGSIEKFSDEMNRTAQRLGMTQTSYVNPNGLPADGQITSARDMAILARAIIHDLPEYEYFVHIPAIKFGKRVTRNFNSLIGRYPGADGMKTGFICASGYNLVASATQNGRRLIAVVLGAPSSAGRSMKAMQLLEQGFSGNSLSWLTPSLGTVDAMVPIAAAPPNLRDDICGPKRKRPAAEDSDDDNVAINTSGGANSFSLFTAAAAAPSMRPSQLLAVAPVSTEPVLVYIGPKKTGAALVAAIAVEAAKQTPKPKARDTRQAHVRAGAKPAADAKPASAKPASAKLVHAVINVAKPAQDKPAATASSAKPKNGAAPKRAEKPAGPKTQTSASPTNARVAAKRPAEKPKDAPKAQ